MTKNYHIYMQRCLELAKKGLGNVEPNPMVGAVIVDETTNTIISEGYHTKYGCAHAESEAILAAKGPVEGKTMFVNLEPCSHQGKNPPCADLIIKNKIKKVVIGSLDPNPLVSGKGIKKLKDAGIIVVEGFLKKECDELNKVFFKNIVKKKPFVTLKTAVTLDGKIALENGESKWITCEKSRKFVQHLRSRYSAIMSGSGTVLKDNPHLNCRIDGLKSPDRIIFDRDLKIPFNFNVYKSDGKKIFLITNASALNCPSYIKVMKFENFDLLFKKLYELNVYSIFVEGGAGLNSALINSKEADELYQFIAPKIFGRGKDFAQNLSVSEIKNCVKLKDIKIQTIENDVLIQGKFDYENTDC